MLGNAVWIYLILGWMVFCGTIYSYVLYISPSMKDIVKYLVFSLFAWPYTIYKLTQK